MGLYDRVREAADFVRKRRAHEPAWAIILGTGLGDLEKHVSDATVVPYEEIPHFVRSTLETHAGRLVLGNLAGEPIVMMSGRFHLYEGYDTEQVTFPVRVMRALGARRLLISNVSGGLNPDYDKGDIVIIDDHINLLGVNPLAGPNDERLGPRYPDMCEPYSRRLTEAAGRICAEEKIPHRFGVYAALLGPSLETRAEYRFLRTIGADCVGMSTVPEVIVGVHAGFEIAAFSIITDMCIPETLEPVCIESIIKVAAEAQPRLVRLVERLVGEGDGEDAAS